METSEELGDKSMRKTRFLNRFLPGVLLFGFIQNNLAQNVTLSPAPPPPALRITHGAPVDCSKGTTCYGLPGIRVKVHVVIGTDGKAASVVALDGDKRFLDSVVKAVHQYRFRPCVAGQQDCNYDFTVVTH